MTIALISIVAFILEFIFKEIKAIPSLKTVLSNYIKYLEISIRRVFRKGKKAENVAGALLTFIVFVTAFLIPFIILSLLYHINTVLGVVFEIFLCFQILGLGSLKEKAMKVYNELYMENLDGAQKSLSNITTRQTNNLDENQVVTTTIESIAKNTNDKVVAPLFYIIIGGASLGLLYKAINVLDAKVGYKTSKYINFGLFPAKLDDIMNIIPARITGFLYVAAALLSGFDYKSAYKILIRDRWAHESPNSGYPESALAGALGIQIGGNDVTYFGETFTNRKPIGDDIKEPDMEDIPKSCMLMTIVSVLALVFILLAKFSILFIINI